MPELPEVETTRRGIAPRLEGLQVDRVVVRAWRDAERSFLSAGFTGAASGTEYNACPKHLLLAVERGHATAWRRAG